MMRRIRSIRNRLVKAVRDARGSVTIIFAFALTSIMVAAGCAVDYSQAARSRTHIATSADAAALAAAKAAQTYMTANGIDTASFAAASALAQTAMTQTFTANQASDSYSQNVTATLTMTQDVDGSPVAKVAARANAPTVFMRIVGIMNTPVGVSAQAKGSGGTYYQIVFVVDVSNSMSIGGTAADIANIQANNLFSDGNADGTYTKCAFACHDKNKNRSGSYASDYCASHGDDGFCLSGPLYCPWGPNGCGRVQTNTFADRRKYAKERGYKLKIDYVNDAISTFIAQLKPLMDRAPAYYSVGINTFGTTFTQLQSMTNNSTALQASAALIDVEAEPTGGGFSQISTGLQTSLSNTTNIGDGSSPAKRKTFFIFVTDGVQDRPSGNFYGRDVDINYSSVCTTVKNAGTANSRPVIFTIDAGYSPLYKPYPTFEGVYRELIVERGYDTQIPVVLRNCATPTNQYQTYFRATDGAAIKVAVQQAFTNIFGTGALHISQ